MLRNLEIRLDDDLKQELRGRLRREGLEWRFLPLAMQMRLLQPFVERQLERERPLLSACCG